MMIKNIILFTLIAIICCHGQAPPLVPKNLAGPPSEFVNFVLPDPKQVAQSSNSALIQVQFSSSQTINSLEWSATVPVDTDDDFTISILSNWTGQIQLTAVPPTTKHHRGHGYFAYSVTPVLSNGSFGIDGNVLPSTSYTFSKPTVGLWTITLTASPSILASEPGFKRLFDAGQPQAFLLSQNPSEFLIYTYLNSYNGLFVGEQVPVLAMLTSAQEILPSGSRPANYLPTPIKASQVLATMLVTSPNGQTVNVPMGDDGLHGDGEANDGIYGAYVQATEVGNYQTSVVFKGIGPDGDALLRTTQHIIPITSEFLTLTGKALASQSNESVSIYLEVETASTNIPDVRLYAEVWGTNDGQDVAVAWVGGVASLAKYNNLNVLSAVLDNRWIALANATAPFSLRNVLVQDINTFVPVFNTTESLAVKFAGRHQYRDVRADIYDPPLSVITKQMRDGKMPAHLAARYGKVRTAAEGNGKLILVHGYCADSNPFTITDFENAVAFEDLGQNRPNNDFSKLVAEFGAQFTDGFSIVGHSQGGLVALHLATYYHSGLDLSTALPGRVIQSVGSPYQGTGLAGTLASIGNVIGIGCSANNDLTHDGAALWLNTIPTDKRALVYFTTTQYKTGGLINSCNLAANAVLSWPNDGVIATDKGVLTGATYANHFKKYCHTTDMNSPPQCEYHDNNKDMSNLSVW